MQDYKSVCSGYDLCQLVNTETDRFGCHSFRMCGPTIWNKLPRDLLNKH